MDVKRASNRRASPSSRGKPHQWRAPLDGSHRKELRAMDGHPHHHHRLDADRHGRADTALTTSASPAAPPGLNRLALSATLHCLTGCGIGEVLGMVFGIAFGWGNLPTVALAVALTFAFGYARTRRSGGRGCSRTGVAGMSATRSPAGGTRWTTAAGSRRWTACGSSGGCAAADRGRACCGRRWRKWKRPVPAPSSWRPARRGRARHVVLRPPGLRGAGHGAPREGAARRVVAPPARRSPALRAAAAAQRRARLRGPAPTSIDLRAIAIAPSRERAAATERRA